MEFFFAKDFSGSPFTLMGREHLLAMAILIALNIALLRLRNSSPALRKQTALVMALVLWANEIGWHVWNASIGKWDLQTMLPLHVCSILVWLGGWMLVRRDKTIYEYMYFLGIGGALQAILTPDLGIYGYPHYRFFQTFISHGLIVTAAIYMTTVEGFRPTWGSMKRVIIGGNIYMLIVTGINWLVGGNYMFTMHKPETASLFDIMPAWPWYLLVVQLIGLVMFLILYLPFIIKDWRAGKQETA
ncbi:MAG: TIGR02206 family membrane protein [Chloroflexi bacterium HGW-Chloroflexi-6]|nr:MAG: TIGR02206 family membrane protein [Chloroflexi bacterium HGW-Chloroflexi-6]